MKQKSILTRLLSVVCTVCLALTLVFGLVACGEEERLIKSMAIDPATGKIVVTYTNGDVEPIEGSVLNSLVPNAPASCKHENSYLMEKTDPNHPVTVEMLLQAQNPNEAIVIPADKCRLDEMRMCADCGEIFATYAKHDESILIEESASCLLGSYEGTGCKYCNYVSGTRNNDAIGHTWEALENSNEFMAALLGKTSIDPCTETHYPEGKICNCTYTRKTFKMVDGDKVLDNEETIPCGMVDIPAVEATGHTYDKESATYTYATTADKFVMKATCVDCDKTFTVCELDNLADGNYTIAPNGAKDNTGHYVKYIYTGSVDVIQPEVGENKFEDGTKTVAFEEFAVSGTQAISVPHYITKNGTVATKYEIKGNAITDYADGVYSNLYLKGATTALSCDTTKPELAMDASAICEFCKASVDVKVYKPHTGVTIKSYGTNPCDLGETDLVKTHIETWNCTVCGDFAQEVADRTHEEVLSTADDAVSYSEVTGKFTLKMVCKYCAAPSIKEATNVTPVKAETCGTAGEYTYTDENGKVWDLTKPATGKHVYEVGKEVVYTSANNVNYDDAVAYIGKSVFLGTGYNKVVCGTPTPASLICPGCNQAVAIVINRTHKLDKVNSKAQAQTCVGVANSTEYCAYADCEHKYVEGALNPYFTGILNPKHNFVFDRFEGANLVVKCTNAGCPEGEVVIRPFVEGSNPYGFKKVDAECVTGKECADYAAGTPNKNVYTFSYTANIPGWQGPAITGETYKVTEIVAVDTHKFGVAETGFVLDPANTEYAAEILANSYLQATSAAETCQDKAEYSFICPDCKQSVTIEVMGKHQQGANQVVPASCEMPAYYECSVAGCDEKVKIDGSKPTGHNEKVEVIGAGASATVKITCDCGLNITTTLADAKITKGEAADCESANYTYAYTNVTDFGTYTEEFKFIAKTGVVAHTFVGAKEGFTGIKMCYVIVNGTAVRYDATNVDHIGLTTHCGYYCTTCEKFVEA